MSGFLDIRGVTRSFGGLRAVDNVSFSVQSGLIKGIIGPNGAGKTTLFNLIAGALRPDAGEIVFRGVPLQGKPPHRIAREGIARTFQTVKLFRGMSVLENVMVGRHLKGGAGFFAAMARLPRTFREERTYREKAMEILRFLDLTEYADRDAVNLPFGLQRIVEIARALAAEPSLLLLDEPAAGLTMYETARMSELIARIRDDGLTVLVIEHDMSLMMGICDEIVVLSSGKKIAEGRPEEIQKNREVVRVYLGDEDVEGS